MMYIFLDRIRNEAATFTNGTNFWRFLGDWKHAMTEKGYEDLATKFSVYTIPASDISYQTWDDILSA